ncbi:MAG: HEAT repeat domain-containing protein [Pseudomonadota bacterium]|nr:HEAT repeat domain-containing protein [Pseudomonadota bacterium]
MRHLFRNLRQKASRLPQSKVRILALLTIGIFLKTFAFVLWDIGAVSILIADKGLFLMGIDFIGVSLLVMLVGFSLWRMERRKGRGCVFWCLCCLLAATISLVLGEWGYIIGFTHMAFILKYVFFFVLSVAFWSVAKRFVNENFSSLKFLSLFCLDFMGFMLAGGISLAGILSPIGLMVAALFCLIGLTLVFITIFDIAPLPAETFVRNTDGIQDVFERPLVWDILILSFLGTVARILSEAVLYTKLAQTGIMPMTVLGLVWFLFGALGLLMVLVLYHTRYIYTTLAGMMVFGFSIIFTGYSALGRHSGPVATGYLMMMLGAHFYLNSFLRILPRVLSGGRGTRLKKRIMTIATPLGFVLCGSIYLNFHNQIPSYCLMATGSMIIIVALHAVWLYSRVLKSLFQMRLWRKGPIMLSYKKLLTRLKQLLQTSNPDDGIYALSILRIANHPYYEVALSQSLSHPAKEVRLFALNLMKDLYHFPNYRNRFYSLMKNDPSSRVRNQSLCDLILTEIYPQKHLSNLKNHTLRAGAIAGFLERGPEWIPAVSDALQTLLRSKNVRDIITGLSIIADHPHPQFTPFVEPFLKHPHRAVVRGAITAAGHLQSPQLLPRVIRALDDTDLQECALNALKNYGKAAFPPIEKAILNPQTHPLRRKQLVLFLGALHSGEGKQILLRALTVENQKLKKAIAQNILDSGIIWTTPDKGMILRTCIQKDLDRIQWLLHMREIFVNAPTHESEESFEFLLRALQEDINDTRDLILYQLLLFKSTEMFTHAIRILLTDSYELYLPAIGVIQDLLPNRFYQKLKSVLILPLSQKRQATYTGMTIKESVIALSQIIQNPPVHLNHWIRATALYALRRLGSPLGIATAESALSDPHPVVLEAAIWALVRLNPNQDDLHHKLLSIPTSRLSDISLDKILET